MYLGIDLGTSSVKVILVDGDQRLVAQASAPLAVQRPHPTWSEQNPEDWWGATLAALGNLRRGHAKQLREVRGIGLSGQMHGATLLDSAGAVLRPAILWNDGRSVAECRALERAEPALHSITANAAMPGFTAPKLAWVARNEPETFRRIAKVLLPKDYVRYRLTGDFATDLADASGTLWVNVARRCWSKEMLAATGLGQHHMPTLHEGCAPTGSVRAELAPELGLSAGVTVYAGAGDNAAGAVGAGVVMAGQGLLSLGTSGVFFVTTDGARGNPERGLHTFCHALPAVWHNMSVTLSAASCLTWLARVTGARNELELLDELASSPSRGSTVLFLPYLSGERTPHDDPHARGVFFNLSHDTSRADLTLAVLEGVAFAFADGQEVLMEAGTRIEEVSVVGGGSRSLTWGKILASALERPLVYRLDSDVGPALGAARLACLGQTGGRVEEVCKAPPVQTVVEPDPRLSAEYRERLQSFRKLYRLLKSQFAHGS
jgi:xylulokinase